MAIMDEGLTNISPLDGRYRKELSGLNQYFSEYSYIKTRLTVEIEYLKYLAKFKIIRTLTQKEEKKLNLICDNFSEKDALVVKKIEAETRHDVKAIEYFLRKKFSVQNLTRLSTLIHIGLTSEDVNNLALGLNLKRFKLEVVNKLLADLLGKFKNLVIKYQNTALLARTHGQPAVTTTFGKEIGNFYFRIRKQQSRLASFEFEGKLNGAVGLYNGLNFIYPKINWLKFSQQFISRLGLKANLITTQILPYDNWLEFFEIVSAINSILIGLCQDFWTYIMLNELKLRKSTGLVGSSTMPQKINPINFENAEGNLQLANSLLYFFSNKLRSSRLQRDLSDSTVRRNFGTALSLSVLGWQMLRKGLSKTGLDQEQINENIDNHWEVLAEPIQLYLRLKGDEKAYERLKSSTQGKKFSQTDYQRLIRELKLDKNKKFSQLTPWRYVGLAGKIINYLLHL